MWSRDGSHSLDHGRYAGTAPVTSGGPLVFGGGTNTGGGYSDIDLLFTADSRYIHKDGTPY